MTTPRGTIDDLTREFPETSAGTQWQMLSDAVMGGVSAGRMSRTTLAQRPAIRMQGDVSLENNGGFIQIAIDLAPNGAACDAAGFTGIAIDVLGNGEEYGFVPGNPTARVSSPRPCGRRSRSRSPASSRTAPRSR